MASVQTVQVVVALNNQKGMFIQVLATQKLPRKHPHSQEAAVVVREVEADAGIQEHEDRAQTNLSIAQKQAIPQALITKKLKTAKEEIQETLHKLNVVIEITVIKDIETIEGVMIMVMCNTLIIVIMKDTDLPEVITHLMTIMVTIITIIITTEDKLTMVTLITIIKVTLLDIDLTGVDTLHKLNRVTGITRPKMTLMFGRVTTIHLL